ncbi:MAG: sigma-70 family RNA polymerase sigma factor [Bacteroidales bacterium]
MELKDETQLIRRILGGEPQAFSVLVRRYQRPLFSLVGQIVGCREDVEEITQDIFMKAFTKLDTFQGGSSLSTWLHRIAYNTAISATRRKKLPRMDFDDLLLNNIPDTQVDEMLNRQEDEALMLQVEMAIEQLPPEDRALLSLYYTQQKPVGEVAAITGFTDANVKIKLYRIRKKIAFLINRLS